MRSVQTGTIEHRLVLGSPEQALPTLNEAVACFAGVAGLSSRNRGDLELLLEELVSNIFDYGYGPGRSGTIHIALRRSDAALEITLCDRAPAFDPLAIQPACNPATLDDARIGGVGIALVRRLASGARYRRVAGRNMLILRLRDTG